MLKYQPYNLDPHGYDATHSDQIRHKLSCSRCGRRYQKFQTSMCTDRKNALFSKPSPIQKEETKHILHTYDYYEHHLYTKKPLVNNTLREVHLNVQV